MNLHDRRCFPGLAAWSSVVAEACCSAFRESQSFDADLRLEGLGSHSVSGRIFGDFCVICLVIPETGVIVYKLPKTTPDHT